MNLTQEKLLALAQTKNIGNLSYYSIAKKLNIRHHNNIKYHLSQLEKEGYLIRNKKTGVVTITGQKSTQPILRIPIYGQANCGEALQLADDTVKDYLKLSPSVLKTKDLQNVYALKAVGNSMNMADISGVSIDDGDFVIVRPVDSGVRTGDYVVSLFDGLANIKRLYIDMQNSRYILTSESTEGIDPIIVAKEDFETYSPIAKVLEVIKGIQQL